MKVDSSKRFATPEKLEELRAIVDAPIKKRERTVITPFEITPRLQRAFDRHPDYIFSVERKGPLVLLFQIQDKIVTKHKITTTIGSEKEILDSLDSLITLLSYDMSVDERKYYFLKEGELPEVAEVKNTTKQNVTKYNRDAKIIKIIKNPYRDGTISAEEFEKVEVGFTPKELIAKGVKGKVIRKGWAKGYVVFE